MKSLITEQILCGMHHQARAPRLLTMHLNYSPYMRVYKIKISITGISGYVKTFLFNRHVQNPDNICKNPSDRNRDPDSGHADKV